MNMNTTANELTAEQVSTVNAIVEQGRNAVIAAIRKSLKERSGKAWSVTGGRGTAWGWIDIAATPARRVEYGYTSEADRAELATLLGEASIHTQGKSIPAQSDFYRVAVAQAMFGTAGNFTAQAQWD